MAETFPSAEAVGAETRALILPRFDAAAALALGSRLIGLAAQRGLGLIVNIRDPQRCYFHAATAGASANNDNWARRKSNTALLFGKSSLEVGCKMRESGGDLARHGLTAGDYADAGGAVPLLVAGAGMVAVLTVSGLPQLDDHALALEAIRAHIAQSA